MNFIYWLDDVFASLSDWLDEFANETINGIEQISTEITEILHNINTLLETFEIYMWVSGAATVVILIMLISVLYNQFKIKKQLKSTDDKIDMLLQPEKEYNNIEEEAEEIHVIS